MNIQDANLNFKGMDVRNVGDITTLFYHHSDGHGSVQEVHSEHLARGWSGIGYNIYIRQDGSIWKGRPTKYVPAGVLAHNSNSVHICCEGSLMTEHLTAAQLNSLKESIDYLKSIIPNLKTCLGHGEVMATDCPGANFPLTEMKAYFNRNVQNVVLTSQPAQPKVQSNETIRQIQSNLNLLHISDLNVDGLQGPLTTAAIKKFQTIMGLASDGIAGPNTHGAISQILSRPLDGVKFPHYEYATRYIQGRVGAHIDGIFGNGTAVTVKTFQGNNGLGADGIVGIKTWSKLI